MSNRNWFTPPGGWGKQPFGQGRDGDNRGARQRRSFDDKDYDFVDDRDYRHRASDGQDYEARRRAIFQVQGDRDTNPPLPQLENGPGVGGGLHNQGAPHPNLIVGVGPQSQAEDKGMAYSCQQIFKEPSTTGRHTRDARKVGQPLGGQGVAGAGV